ncbi:unnamed protein product [Malus baccata var. baccata]
MQEEEETPENGSGGSGGSHTHLWWAGASAAQLAWAVMSSRKGCAGNSFTMPFKAFAVASLYVGSVATAGVAGLHASGIREVIFPFLYLSFPGVYQSFYGNYSLGSIAIYYIDCIACVICNYNYGLHMNHDYMVVYIYISAAFLTSRSYAPHSSEFHLLNSVI